MTHVLDTPLLSPGSEKRKEPAKEKRWRNKWICNEAGAKQDGRWYNENEIWWSPVTFESKKAATDYALNAYRKWQDYPWDFLGAFETE